MLEQSYFLRTNILNREWSRYSQFCCLFNTPIVITGVHVVMQVAAVVSAMRVNHEADTDAGFRPRLVHSSLQPLNRDGKLLGSTTNLPGGPGNPFGKQVADALAPGNHLNKPEHRLLIAEPQVNATGVLAAEQSTLEALHGKGDNLAC